jgi:hypothetical protein
LRKLMRGKLPQACAGKCSTLLQVTRFRNTK